VVKAELASNESYLLYAFLLIDRDRNPTAKKISSSHSDNISLNQAKAYELPPRWVYSYGGEVRNPSDELYQK